METDIVWFWGLGCIILVAWLIFSEGGPRAPEDD